MKLRYFFWIALPILGYLFTNILAAPKNQTYDISEDLLVENVRELEAVAALGQLVPSSEVRRLAAPVSGFGGTPRIYKLLISEGDKIRKGQVLAVFDNRPQILADINKINARISTLKAKIKIQQKQVERYKQVAIEGATSIIILENKQDQLINLEGEKQESLAELQGLEADLFDTQLRSPVDGVILSINFRVGERPNSEGVVEVGSNQSMQAIIEVYESDIARVSVGQEVSLISENGGFSGTLNGVVYKISPQVKQRKVLSTDPTGDADARIVEVRVELDIISSELVSNLTGMKVIARFK